MIALSPEAYRALMESGQAAADRCTLEAAGLFVTPLPPSLMRLVDEDNVFYAREPEAIEVKPAPRLNYSTLFLTVVVLGWIASMIWEATGGK